MPKDNRTVLVTGGAGYIGSHAVLALKHQGWQPLVVDDFSRGSRESLQALDAPYVEGDLLNRSFIDNVIGQSQPIAVMHFAALAYVGESVTDPERYYTNNISGTLNLLHALRSHGVNNFIFSSTCATYGVPESLPIVETTPQDPINPYGRSKLMVEQILEDFELAYGIQSVRFRYFNAAGADPLGRIGENHRPETHLIPLAIEAARGNGILRVFGDDYPTADGTCIRDYIHVSDIAAAHVLGLELLINEKRSNVFNLGNGNGYSIRDVIEAVRTVSGKDVPYSIEPRRPGDPPTLVADASKAFSTLKWNPLYPSLHSIVETAWRWHTR